ncbi:hypothetical protein ABZ725_49785 [Streptomyces sp. NPDC006872]|uniref:hypothetical protein n=1 Tax=Streptomyces sp. NPDC006872 TaxID=3155720 RepID=UPI0033F4595E
MFGRHAVNAHLLLGRQPIIVDAGTPGSGQRAAGSGQLIHDQVAAHGVDPVLAGRQEDARRSLRASQLDAARRMIEKPDPVNHGEPARRTTTAIS